MPAKTSNASKSQRGTGKHALALLKKDHETVAGLFEQFDKAKEPSRKAKIFSSIKSALEVHARIEEQIFYKEAESEAGRELQKQLKEAHGEHAIVKKLMGEGASLDPDSGEFDATVAGLKGAVEHHVEEEETEMFKEIRKAFSRAELQEMGQRMQELKRSLQAR